MAVVTVRLVRRNPDPHDRRATRITLTDDGIERARRAAQVHVASIEKHFSSRLGEPEATALAEALESIEDDVNTSRTAAPAGDRRTRP
jgi:DNA-binding MarR family transcriptional regulator